MSTQSEMAPQSTRTRNPSTDEILSRKGGVFWGVVFLLVGALWFLDTADVIDLGGRLAEFLLPILFILGGLYLLTMKLMRR